VESRQTALHFHSKSQRREIFLHGSIVMSKTYVIEIDEAVNPQVAGHVVLERSGFRFASANRAFASLDGCLFRSPSEARKVAGRISAALSARRPRERCAAAPIVETPHVSVRYREGTDHVEH
jgi:hypothetical protein